MALGRPQFQGRSVTVDELRETLPTVVGGVSRSGGRLAVEEDGVVVAGLVPADDLLPERALLGDMPARHLLIERVFTPLQRAGGALLETATAYLHGGRGVEATARALFVHPNTVRYRLGKIAEVTGYDLGDPREAHVVRTAVALGTLGRGSRPPRWDGPS